MACADLAGSCNICSCVKRRRSHHAYQTVVAIRSDLFTPDIVGCIGFLERNKSAKTDPPSRSAEHTSEMRRSSPKMRHTSCTLGQRKNTCLTLSQSDVHKGHCELVIMCLLASTSWQGIAPNKVLQTWIF